MRERIPDSELNILRILWDAGGNLSMMQIKDELEKRMNKEYGKTTVATWLARLKKKKLITSYTIKKTSFYSAAIERREYEKIEMSLVAKRLFDNSFTKMLAFFAGEEELSDKSKKRIQEILDELDG